MGLLKKLFGRPTSEPETGARSSYFHDSDTTGQSQGSRNAPRRELVHVVSRDTMRKHGIPSDWIDCRSLSVVTSGHVSGMHVHFIVRKEQTRLLAHVQPFQNSFWKGIEKFDPRAREWLLSVAWQFEGDVSGAEPAMQPVLESRGADRQPGGDTQPDEMAQDDVASDLKALYAIRDAALSQAGEVSAATAQAGTSDVAKARDG
jgi:hypothetical protein